MTTNVAIVTGGSRGLGPHIATALAESGYPVVLTARTRHLVEQHAAEINRAGGTALGVTADVTAAADRRRILDAAQELGPVGVLVNNAAVGPIRHFHDQTTDDLAEIVEVNLTAPMELTRLVVNGMLERGTAGRIVNVASVAAKLPMPNMVLYSVTKAALSQFSAALDLEYRERNIRASTVLPGAIADEGMAVRAIQETGVDIPSDGAVPPDVVARAVLAAIDHGRAEVFVGAGSKFMTKHPGLAYRLMRRAGVLAALDRAADHYTSADRTAA